MPKRFKLLSGLWLVYLLVLAGCQRTLDVTLPAEPSRLVVQAFFSPDEVFQARIDRTYPPTGETRLDTAFSVATAVIFENNEPIDTLRYTRNNVYRSPTGRRPRAGMLYRLQLQAPGFPDAVSRDELMPDAPQLDTALLTKTGDYVLQIALAPATRGPGLYAARLSGRYQRYPVQILATDLLRPDGVVANCGFRQDSETLYYQASCWPNQRVRAHFSSSFYGVVPDFFRDSVFADPNRQSDQIQLQLRSVTQSYWDYYRTLPNQEGFDKAFLQPATRLGNIEGGYGLVGAYHERTFRYAINP